MKLENEQRTEMRMSKPVQQGRLHLDFRKPLSSPGQANQQCNLLVCSYPKLLKLGHALQDLVEGHIIVFQIFQALAMHSLSPQA